MNPVSFTPRLTFGSSNTPAKPVADVIFESVLTEQARLLKQDPMWGGLLPQDGIFMMRLVNLKGLCQKLGRACQDSKQTLGEVLAKTLKPSIEGKYEKGPFPFGYVDPLVEFDWLGNAPAFILKTFENSPLLQPEGPISEFPQ